MAEKSQSEKDNPDTLNSPKMGVNAAGHPSYTDTNESIDEQILQIRGNGGKPTKGLERVIEKEASRVTDRRPQKDDFDIQSWMKEKKGEGARKAASKPLFEKNWPSKESAKKFVDGVVDGAKSAGSLADMVLGVGGMVTGLMADAAVRVEGIALGKSHEETSKKGEEAYNWQMQKYGNPVETILNSFGTSYKGEYNPVDRGMGVVQKGIEKGGQFVEDHSNGVINRDDFSMLTNTLMTALGARGATISAEAFAKKIMEKKAAGEPKPITAATNDVTFASKLGEFEREEIAKHAEKADAAVEKGTGTSEEVKGGKESPPAEVSTDLKVEVPSAGGLPRSENVSLERYSKIKSTPEFLRTPEDRLAAKAWDEQAKTDEGFGKALEASEKPGFARTAEDKAWLRKYGTIAVSAAMGLAAWEALKDDDRDRMMTMAITAMGIAVPEARRSIASLGDATPLGVALETGKYDLKTLNRLPPNKFEFAKSHIEQELKRADVSQAERDVLTKVLSGVEGDKVTAKQLVQGFQKETGDYELKANVVQDGEHYEDYGLGRINRNVAEHAPGEEPAEDEEPGGVHPRTTMYEMPEHMPIGGENHFGNDRMFGWTRSFHDEEGVRHVVEVQSDLMQHLKPPDGEKAQKAQEALENNKKQEKIWSKLSPLAKTWSRRLIREELHEAFKAGEKSVRFATADTVAKVEGWPTERPQIDQGIYNRYKTDVEKFLKQEGGTPHKDPMGHTWIEVPVKEPKPGAPGASRVQQLGGVDSKLLTLLGAGALGAWLGYEAFDTKAATALGAFLGYEFGKHVPGMRESMKQTPAAREAVKELRTRLFSLNGANEARGLNILNLLKKTLPKDWSTHAHEIYEHLDSGKELSPRAQELHDSVIVPLQKANIAMMRALETLGIPIAEIKEDYGFHRVRQGVRASLFDALGKGAYPFSKSLSTTAPSALDRTVHKYTTASGESYVGITEKGGKVALYADGKVFAKGALDPKTKELKSQGKVFQQGRAAIEDIEKNTSLRYYKEPLLAELDANFRLGQALNNAYFLKTLPELPGAEEFMKRVEKNQPVPEGWRIPSNPSLRQYAFAPRIAETIEDLTGTKADDASKAVGNLNRILVGSMFWNPFPHIINVLDHAIVEKGLVGMATSLPSQLKTGIEAYKEVTNYGPKYLIYMREGAGLMYPDTVLGDFTQQVLKAVGTKPEMGMVAKAFGYANPLEMAKRLYEASRQFLWRWNDILMMQGYLMKERSGLSLPEAISTVEKHIPNYRLPERVLGSRGLQKVLGDPAFTTFGRYDYGRLASYGNMIKDILGKDPSLKDRAHALDQVAMLAVMSTLVYPAVMDTIAQNLTGNKNAEFTRFGASTIPTLAYNVWQGKELGLNAIGKMFHVSPVIELAAQGLTNRDLFSGGAFAHTPSEALKKVAKNIAPVNMMDQQAEGKQSLEQMFWSALGIKSPTDEQKEKKDAYLERQKKAIERYKEKLEERHEE